MMPDDSLLGPPWLARVTALFMISCLGAGLVAVVFTGLRVPWPGGDRAIMVGEWTFHYERGMDDDFITRDVAIGFWGGIEWALFGEGRRGVVPGRDGWLFTIEEFEQPPAADAQVAQKIAQIITAGQRLADAGVPRLVIALIPDKSRVYADMLGGVGRRPAQGGRYDDVRQRLLEAGFIAPDLLTPLVAARATTQTHMRTDTHWSPEGAAIVAGELAAAITAGPNPPPSLQISAYTTQVGAAELHEGDLTRFIPLGIFAGVLGAPAEALVPHSTILNPDAPTGDDAGSLLFDEVAIPAVLIGTSFSAMDQWNFDGALQRALGMDVLNLADEGQGPMAPMAAYLASDALRDSPPELVIWEIPERFLPVAYDLPDNGF